MQSDLVALQKNDEHSIEQYTRQPIPTLRDLASVLFRQRWPLLIAFILTLLLVICSGVWIPTYTGHMKIMVLRQRTDTMVSPDANAPPEYGNDQISDQDLNSEVELLNSEDLLRTVVLSTDLVGANRKDERRIAEAVRKLGKDLQIAPIRRSNVISVSYRAANPQMVEKVLQAVAAAYLQKHLEMHSTPGEFKFFDEQATQYKQDMTQAQAQLAAFIQSTGVVSAEQERDSALRHASDFEAAARQAQTSIREIEERVISLQAMLHSINPRVTTVVRNSVNPELMQQLKSTLLNLQLRRTELLTKYDASYPLVQEVDAQIAEAQNAVKAEQSHPMRDESSDQNPNFQWVRSELIRDQAELSGLQARAQASAATAAKYHAQAEALNHESITQHNLIQASKTEEDNYELYMRKREEARISSALDKIGFLNVALAERPIVLTLPKWSPRVVIAVALLLALTCGIFVAFITDAVDPTFRTPDELASYLGAPVLAALPCDEA